MSRVRDFRFETFQECIDFYHKHRKDNDEYVIENGIESAHNNLLYNQGFGDLVMIDDDEKIGRLTVDREAIERFHPNKINNREFWSYAKSMFPKFSVCGSYSRTIGECNEKTLEMPRSVGFLKSIDNLIANAPEKFNFFEIGYGHGNIFKLYNKKVNYKGIDFYKIYRLHKFDNLMIIDKSGIPDSIEDNSQDIVYSINVFQHCSQQDRFEYYRQAYQKLKPGGYFFGGTFIWCKEIADLPVWGVVDENGRYYCNFFNQLTEVDTYDEFREIMTEIGFSLVTHHLQGNYYYFVVKK